MTSKTTPQDQDKGLTNVPLMYADTLMGLGIGPFVSKIILGVENVHQQPNPSIQISMPTNALRDLAKHILTILDQPTAQESIIKGHKEFQDSMKA